MGRFMEIMVIESGHIGVAAGIGKMKMGWKKVIFLRLSYYGDLTM